MNSTDKLVETFTRLTNLSPEKRAVELLAIHERDPAMADELQSLLAAHDAAPDFLDQLDADGAVSLLHEDERLLMPETAGPYRLIREIGRGGLGVVYLAERDAGDFDRRVALKVIKRGMDSDLILKRFHLERRVLASLDHPNIARLIDGGLIEDGRPYFTMELVDGVPITEWCDRHRASVNQRLELFEQVCNAVQYAHRHLVIHRDLKPANILVTGDSKLGDTPEGFVAPRASASPSRSTCAVKLLDFGIARLLGQDDEDRTRLTEAGMHAMTPEYAAPEQVRGETASTATDVYALGVLLYELLSGHHPFRNTADTREELNRAICDSIPPRPSAAISGEHAETTADARRSRPAALRRRLHGDLDNVVQMAMAKEPERRYNSVEAMAEDLRRHRSGLPVKARRETLAYRAGRFIYRHSIGVAITTSVILALAIGLLVVIEQSRIIAAERDIAQFQANRWEVLQSELTLLFRDVATEFDDPDLSARDLLAESTNRIDQRFVDDPASRAQMQAVLGSLYSALQDFNSAKPLLEAFLEEDTGDAPPVLRSEVYVSLALTELTLGNPGRALELIEEAQNILETLPGDRRARLSVVAQSRGRILRALGRFDEALEALETGVELARPAGENAPGWELASALGNLSSLLHWLQRTEEALAASREGMAIYRALGQSESPAALTLMNNRALILLNQGLYDEATPLLEEIAQVRRSRYGDSGSLAMAHIALSTIELVKYRLDEARHHADIAQAMMARSQGKQSPEYALTLRLLARVNMAEGDLHLAEQYRADGHSILESALGRGHPFTTGFRAYRAHILRHSDPDGAVDAFDEAVAELEAAGAVAGPYLSAALCEQALLYLDLDDPQTAVQPARRCRDMRTETLMQGSYLRAEGEAILAVADRRLGDPEAAKRLARSVAALQDTFGEGHPRLEWFMAEMERTNQDPDRTPVQ